MATYLMAKLCKLSQFVAPIPLYQFDLIFSSDDTAGSTQVPRYEPLPTLLGRDLPRQGGRDLPLTPIVNQLYVNQKFLIVRFLSINVLYKTWDLSFYLS